MRKFKFFQDIANHMPSTLIAGIVIEVGKKGVEKIMEHVRGTNNKIANTDNNNTKSQSFKP